MIYNILCCRCHEVVGTQECSEEAEGDIVPRLRFLKRKYYPDDTPEQSLVLAVAEGKCPNCNLRIGIIEYSYLVGESDQKRQVREKGLRAARVKKAQEQGKLLNPHRLIERDNRLYCECGRRIAWMEPTDKYVRKPHLRWFNLFSLINDVAAVRGIDLEDYRPEGFTVLEEYENVQLRNPINYTAIPNLPEAALLQRESQIYKATGIYYVPHLYYELKNIRRKQACIKEVPTGTEADFGDCPECGARHGLYVAEILPIFCRWWHELLTPRQNSVHN